MPNRSSFKSNEDYNEWHRQYRAKNAEKIREYNKEYMRKKRLAAKS